MIALCGVCAELLHRFNVLSALLTRLCTHTRADKCGVLWRHLLTFTHRTLTTLRRALAAQQPPSASLSSAAPSLDISNAALDVARVLVWVQLWCKYNRGSLVVGLFTSRWNPIPSTCPFSLLFVRRCLRDCEFAAVPLPSRPHFLQRFSIPAPLHFLFFLFHICLLLLLLSYVSLHAFRSLQLVFPRRAAGLHLARLAVDTARPSGSTCGHTHGS